MPKDGPTRPNTALKHRLAARFLIDELTVDHTAHTGPKKLGQKLIRVSGSRNTWTQICSGVLATIDGTNDHPDTHFQPSQGRTWLWQLLRQHTHLFRQTETPVCRLSSGDEGLLEVNFGPPEVLHARNFTTKADEPMVRR